MKRESNDQYVVLTGTNFGIHEIEIQEVTLDEIPQEARKAIERLKSKEGLEVKWRPRLNLVPDGSAIKRPEER